MSKIKLLNNQGDEVTIEHSDTASAQGNSVVNIKDVTKQVDTIADLKLLDGSHKLVYVTGYHTKGDGAFGRHFFEWDATSTEADNGGTIIKLNSVATGRYKLKYDDCVYPEYFGAKGDGSDDTQSFDNFTNYLRNSDTKEGKLLGKTYALHYWDLSNLNKINISGASRTSTKIVTLDNWTGIQNANNEKCFVMINNFYGGGSTANYSSYSTSTEFKISNITVEETSLVNDETTIGIYMSRSTRCSIENFLFVGFGSTLKIVHSWLFSFRNGSIIQAYKYGLYLAGGGSQINGASFYDVDFSNTRSSLADNSSCIKNEDQRRVYFYGCYFEGTFEYAFYITGIHGTMNIIGGGAEFTGKKTLTYFNDEYCKLFLTDFISYDCILCDSNSSLSYGCNISLSNCQIRDSEIAGVLYSACSYNSINVPSQVIDFKYTTNKLYCGEFRLQHLPRAYMSSWNVLTFPHYVTHIYGSNGYGNETNTYHIPTNMLGRKIIIELTPQGSSGDLQYSSTKYQARFEYTGTEVSGDELTKIYESESSDASIKLSFVSMSNNILTLKATKQGGGTTHTAVDTKLIFAY